MNKETRTPAEIDAANLRFYANLFREHQWQSDILHWSVFATTLDEIADRIQQMEKELTDVRQLLAACRALRSIEHRIAGHNHDDEDLRS